MSGAYKPGELSLFLNPSAPAPTDVVKPGAGGTSAGGNGQGTGGRERGHSDFKFAAPAPRAPRQDVKGKQKPKAAVRDEYASDSSGTGGKNGMSKPLGRHKVVDPALAELSAGSAADIDTEEETSLRSKQDREHRKKKKNALLQGLHGATTADILSDDDLVPRQISEEDDGNDGDSELSIDGPQSTEDDTGDSAPPEPRGAKKNVRAAARAAQDAIAVERAGNKTKPSRDNRASSKRPAAAMDGKRDSGDSGVDADATTTADGFNPMHESLASTKPQSSGKRAKKKQKRVDEGTKAEEQADAAEDAEGDVGDEAASEADIADLAEGSEEDDSDYDPKTDPEASKEKRTLFVGNVPLDTSQKKLKSVFAEHGKVESVRFRSVPVEPESKLPKKAAFIKKQFNKERQSMNAYVVMGTEEQAEAALALNGYDLDGFHLRVDKADHKLTDTKSSIFLGNLPFNVTEEQVRQLFSNVCGEIENVRIVRDKQTNVGKGIGYVQFKDAADVKAALTLHKSSIGDREIRIMRAVDRQKLDAARKPTRGGFRGGRGARGGARGSARGGPAAAGRGRGRGRGGMGAGSSRGRGGSSARSSSRDSSSRRGRGRSPFGGARGGRGGRGRSPNKSFEGTRAVPGVAPRFGKRRANGPAKPVGKVPKRKMPRKEAD